MTTVDKLYGMASMNSFNDDFESSDDDVWMSLVYQLLVIKI